MVQTTRDRPHLAVLKKVSGFDDYGRHKVDVANEVAVRWEESHREVTDGEGNRISVDVQAEVGEEIPVGSEMWLGDYEETSSPADGKRYEVVTYESIPDSHNIRTRRFVTLRRKSDTAGDAV